MKKNWWYIYSFWHNSRTWQTHGHTHRQTLHDGIGRAYAKHRAAKIWTRVVLQYKYEYRLLHHCWIVINISVYIKKSKLTLRGPWVRLRQLKQVKTSSSAVANRLRDASCLLVVSFVASIIQYLERSFFIISYFGFRFTSAYNLIQFCGLRRNVEPCCHTHDSQSTVIVYSARARLVGLAL